MKKLLSLGLVLTVFVFSCSEDSEVTGETTLTPEEASAEIQSIATTASQDITSILESDGVSAILDLIDLIERSNFLLGAKSPEAAKLQVEAIFQRFLTEPISKVSEEAVTSLDDISGLYVWNPGTSTFDKSESDLFIMQFPTEGSPENNAEFVISELSFEEVAFVYLPTQASSYLRVDETEVANLSFAVTWSAFGFPDTANIRVDLTPFSYTLGFDNLASTSSSLLSSLRLDGVEILGVDVDVNFEDDFKTDITSVEGYVLYHNLKIDGSVMIPTAEEGQDPSQNINDFINLEVLIDGSKVGDIVVIDDDAVLYIQYLDGTLEELEVLFEGAISDIEEIIEGLG